MQTTDYLIILNILVAFLGVLFVTFTLFEWQALRRIRKAIEQYPDDKAGYCDLAYAYLAGHEDDLAVRYFRKAVEVDASADADLRLDAGLTSLLPRILS